MSSHCAYLRPLVTGSGDRHTRLPLAMGRWSLALAMGWGTYRLTGQAHGGDGFEV